MTDTEAVKVFYDILKTVSRDNAERFMRNHFPDQYRHIVERTEFLDRFDVKKTKNSRISMFERVYCLEHGLDDRPRCKTCGEKYVNRFNKQLNEYGKWCSAKCQASDADCVEKCRKTKLERYGDEKYVGSDKAKDTRLAKYGSFHSKDFNEKCRKTKLERYGDGNFVNSEKAMKTKFERYGSENFVNSEQTKKTKLERYGDENWNNREKFKETLSKFSDERKDEIKKKRKETCRSLYGTDHPQRNETVRAKTERTCMELYGATTPLATEKSRRKSIKTIKLKSWDRISSDKEYTPLFEKSEYIENNDPCRLWKWKCGTCGHVFSSRYDDGRHRPCDKCHPALDGCSAMEKELYEFISKTCGGAYNRQAENRSVIGTREIDIVVPKLRIGFEFDGLYWHSDAVGKTKSYHLEKTKLCEKAGWRLIHVFEDEWLEKRDIVKARIRHITGSVKYRIYARKCEVKEIPARLKNRFLDKYHMQGGDRAAVSYGLFYRNRLAAVMTFCKARFDKKREWELSRYASVANFNVIGGAGKLLKHFERTRSPKSLVTYADRRWSAGGLYFKLGFEHSHDSAPNYFYVKAQRRYSRMRFQKHMLAGKLEKFDQSKSEYRNMKNNGYDRIYDCGNMVFVKTYA